MEYHQISKLEEIEYSVRLLQSEMPHFAEKAEVLSYCEKLSRYAYCVNLVCEGEVIGFAATYMNDEISKRAFLTFIGITHSFQRHGYGRELLLHCIERARQHGMVDFGLEVDNDNAAGRAFYHEMGFQTTGITERSSTMMNLAIERYGGAVTDLRRCVNASCLGAYSARKARAVA